MSSDSTPPPTTGHRASATPRRGNWRWIDVDFENVGGAVTEAIIARPNLRPRVVVCGLISGHNEADPPPRPRSFGHLLVQRVHVHENFEQQPAAVNMLFDGANTGKLV